MITITDVTEENVQPSGKQEFNEVPVSAYNSDSRGELSQLIQNFDNMNSEDIDSITPLTTSSDNDGNNSSNNSLNSYSSTNHSTNNCLSATTTTDIRSRPSKNLLLRSFLKEHKKKYIVNKFLESTQEESRV
jgi:hypothetical protein